MVRRNTDLEYSPVGPVFSPFGHEHRDFQIETANHSIVVKLLKKSVSVCLFCHWTDSTV